MKLECVNDYGAATVHQVRKSGIYPLNGDDERGGMSILLEESGDVLYVHSKKQTPKRYMIAPESSNRKSDHKIYTKGSKERCSKKNKK